MKKLVVFFAAVLMLSGLCFSQKIKKPTLTSKEATPEQTATLREGIALHDKKDYAGAIAKYDTVLKENPDCTVALYEKSLSYYGLGDNNKAMETAVLGSSYRSEQLPLFYGIIANVIDDIGRPEEAIKIYQDAIKIIEDDKTLQSHLSSLHYNLGVTYTRQKKYPEARSELKRSIELNYAYGSPHYLLSEVFIGSRYKIPALLAAARFASLEVMTPRATRAATIIAMSLEGARKDPKTGNTVIDLDFLAPKDEGEFGIYDLMLGTLMSVEEGKDKDRSHGERFIDAFDSLIAMLSEDKKLRSTFVGKYYVPFLAEMKSSGHTPAFCYLVLRQAGGNAEAEKWIELNSSKVLALNKWAKEFQVPKK